jgi:uncharacterized repeat protein (TIGR03803 family)
MANMLEHLHRTATSVFLLLLLTTLLPSQLKAQTFEVLYTFNGQNGALPVGQLTLDSAGNIYGTTSAGGVGACVFFADGCGTVFAINKNGKLLGSYSFHGVDGAAPNGGLLPDSAGNFFGTTESGGNYPSACGEVGCGVVFKLTPQGKETAYKFTGEGPIYPHGLLVQDAAGNLYGTTIESGPSNGGTVYELDQTGRLTVLQRLYDDACQVYGLTMIGNDLYGSVVGSYLYCENQYIFQMTTGGSYTEIGFGFDTSILAEDSAGNFYGTSTYDGGYGTVFKLSPNNTGGWTQTTLYTFCQLAGCADGENPIGGPLAIDSAGNIYGTTVFGGTYQTCNGGTCGVVFKLDANGNETVIHDFSGGDDGSAPEVGLAMDSTGNLYGVTTEGGDLACPVSDGAGCGVVFKIAP